MDFCGEFVSVWGEVQAGALDAEGTGSLDPGNIGGDNLENQSSVTECLGSFWFGLFSSFQRLVLFQKELFNHRNVQAARVRKGMFSSLGTVS